VCALFRLFCLPYICFNASAGAAGQTVQCEWDDVSQGEAYAHTLAAFQLVDALARPLSFSLSLSLSLSLPRSLVLALELLVLYKLDSLSQHRTTQIGIP
jgi:hypothetical protein